MQISFIESLLQLYKNWTKKTGYLQNRDKLFMEYMMQACSAGWKVRGQSEEVHHAEVFTEEELADYKRKKKKKKFH